MNYTQPVQQQYAVPQNINYRPQAWMTQPQAIPQVRPVSSIEEVRAHPIEFDGSIFYFPDVANKKIYTKSMNLDGTVVINLYELKSMPSFETPPATDLSAYITRDEFEVAMAQLKKLLSDSEDQEKPKFQF